ncbi:glycoside hydrolase family 28 protein [Komagataeibacter europaeus]|uniref:glycoside hydrolase family 28 protein n=1 Tax=Komagataeibacter europaeus TaxID=33995 RepID=UPI000B3ED366|nr:glycosyl hydrolase family 28 protein [Komagataeibacter europaeus]ARW16989.1 Galacturan 1,4-alpha-galacturonidase [Komagataeibacter europaeus]
MAAWNILSPCRARGPVAAVAVGLVATGLCCVTARAESTVCRPESFGATHDGMHDDGPAITHALEECAGKGMVQLSTGTYLSGALVVPSHTTLSIEKGATLRSALVPGAGTPPVAFLYGKEAGDITLQGAGTIDGAGEAWWAIARQARSRHEKMPPRPRLIAFSHVDDLHVSNLTLRNAPTFHLLMTDVSNVVVDGITISSPADSPNTDGIDPAGRNITIRNVVIDNGDDNIAIKSGHRDPQHPDAATENVVIENCKFLHGHGLSIGSETTGGVRHVRASHLQFQHTTNGLRIKTDRAHGGEVSDIVYDGVTMEDVREPIILTDYYPKIPREDPANDDRAVGRDGASPRIHDVTIQNVTGSGGLMLGYAVGLPDLPIKKVVLRHVLLEAVKPMEVRNADLTFEDTRLHTKKGSPLLQESNVTISGSPE